MKLKFIAVAVISAFLSSSIGIPAQASTTSVHCTSGSITITSNVVTSHSSCTGAVVIPDTVTRIGDFAFVNAGSLTSVTFGPNSQLVNIGTRAFFQATSLTAIAVPDTVTTIGNQAFDSATSLASVTFGPNSQLVTIGTSAFFQATSLTAIAVPDTVTTIGNQAFANATSLTSVTYGPNSQLTTIGQHAFSGAISLGAIAIPDSVTSIGNSAFWLATSLQSVLFLGTPPSLGSGVFLGTASGAKARVSRAHIGSGAGKFGNVGSNWNGLQVEVPTSTLSLNSEGQVATQSVEFGASPTSPSISKTGFTLQGWSTAQGGTATIAPDLSDFTMGPSARTLFAIWEPLPAATSSEEIEPETIQFGGPLLAGVDRRVFDSNVPVNLTFTGKRLHQITAATVKGIKVQIQAKSRGSLTLVAAGLAPGRHTLILETRFGRLTLPAFMVVQ